MNRKNIIAILFAAVITVAYSCSGKSETSENKGEVEQLSAIDSVEVDDDAMKAQAAELVDFVLVSIETGDIETAMSVLQDAVAFKEDLINTGQTDAEKTYSEQLRTLYVQNKEVFERAGSELQQFKEVADLLFAVPADTIK